MTSPFIGVRNGVSGFFYRTVLKPAFFRRDPEDVHDAMTKFGVMLGGSAAGRRIVRGVFDYSHPSLAQDLHGIRFRNPVGLAAGFDKDAKLVDIMPSVGFGFMEIGSVTGEPCDGNPKPRLWRLPRSRALVVNFGLKSDGAVRIAARLEGRRFGVPVGVSVAKTNCARTADLDAGIDDYAKSFSLLRKSADYMTVNISCPNAYGGQPFTDPASLDALLCRLDEIPCRGPVFLKMPPDLDHAAVDALVDVAARHRVDGFICSNLTKDRSNERIRDAAVPEKGGISGKVVVDLSDALIRRVYAATRGKKTVIGCGGVFTAEDAYRKIRAGASLVQLITGMIYEGPQVVSEINRGLAHLLRDDGFSSLTEARGVDVYW